jgi:CubicO group peptidase (beta-lactamase class C family)
VFTCAAICKLVETGIISMNTKVFPEIFDRDINYSICQNSEKITIEHLLNHMVGAWPTTTRSEDPMFSRE